MLYATIENWPCLISLDEYIGRWVSTQLHGSSPPLPQTFQLIDGIMRPSTLQRLLLSQLLSIIGLAAPPNNTNNSSDSNKPPKILQRIGIYDQLPPYTRTAAQQFNTVVRLAS